jgi:prepilin signal peptidase PulO-like enzyme (type II secretory pathway)
MGCYFDSFLGRFIGARVAEYLTIALVVVGLFVLLSFFSRFVRALVLRPLLGGGIIKKYSKDGAWAGTASLPFLIRHSTASGAPVAVVLSGRN